MNVDLFCTVFGFACGMATGWALWCGRTAIADHSIPPDAAAELATLRDVHGLSDRDSDGGES